MSVWIMTTRRWLDEMDGSGDTMGDLDQVVYDPLEVVSYTKRDLGKALCLLRNCLVIDDDTLRSIAEKIDQMWPNRGEDNE